MNKDGYTAMLYLKRLAETFKYPTRNPSWDEKGISFQAPRKTIDGEEIWEDAFTAWEDVSRLLCPSCGGSGGDIEKKCNDWGGHDENTIDCPKCKGTGVNRI